MWIYLNIKVYYYFVNFKPIAKTFIVLKMERWVTQQDKDIEGEVPRGPLINKGVIVNKIEIT